MFGIRVDYLFILAALTVGVAVLGLFIQHHHSGTRRGRFIAWLTAVLCVGGLFSAGFVALLLGWTPGKEWLGMTVAGGGFGFFSGLWGGRFVWKYYQKEIEGDSADRS